MVRTQFSLCLWCVLSSMVVDKTRTLHNPCTSCSVCCLHLAGSPVRQHHQHQQQPSPPSTAVSTSHTIHDLTRGGATHISFADNSAADVIAVSTPLQDSACNSVLEHLLAFGFATVDQPTSHSSGCRVFEQGCVAAAITDADAKKLCLWFLQLISEGVSIAEVVREALLGQSKQQQLELLGLVGRAILCAQADAEATALFRTWALGAAKVGECVDNLGWLQLLCVCVCVQHELVSSYCVCLVEP